MKRYLGRRMRTAGAAMGPHLMMLSRPWIAPFVIGTVLTLGMVLRIYFLDTDLSAPEGGDQGEYFGRAAMLTAGDGYFDPPKWVRSPVYTFFLAAAFRVFGTGVLEVRLIQIVLVLLASGLVYGIARRIAGEKTGLISLGFFVLYLPLVTISNLVMSETLFVVLLLAAFYSLVRWSDRKAGWRWPVGAGFLLALAVLTRGYALAFFPVAALWIWWAGRKQDYAGWQRVAVFAAAFLLLLAPWTFRNALVYDAFIPVDTTGGYNFWLANGGFSDKSEMEKQLLPIQSYAQRDRFAYQQGLTYITSHPRETVENAVTNLFYLAKLEYLPDMIRVDKQVEPINQAFDLALGDIPFVLALLLGPAGLFMTRRKAVAALFGLWLGFSILMALLTPVDFIGLRYRLPMMPFLFIGIGVFLSGIRLEIFSLRRWNWIPIALVVSIVFVAAELLAYQNLPLVFSRVQERSSLIEQADARYLSGDFAGASYLYSGVLTLQPDYLDALIGKGNALLAQNQPDEAVKSFEAAQKINPYDVRPRAGLAECYRRSGETDKAAKQARVDKEQGLLSWSFEFLPVSKQRVVDIGSLDFGYVYGFSKVEKDGNITYRRAKEHAKIRFGEVAKADALELRLASVSGDHLQVAVFINGVEAGKANPGEEFKVYKFRIPAGVKPPFEVQLKSSTGISGDGSEARLVGVAVDLAGLVVGK